MTANSDTDADPDAPVDATGPGPDELAAAELAELIARAVEHANDAEGNPEAAECICEELPRGTPCWRCYKLGDKSFDMDAPYVAAPRGDGA